MQRTLTMPDGVQFKEQLEVLDDQSRTLRYRILEPAPFPVTNYVGTVAVRDLGSGKVEVEWTSTFQPNGAPEEALVEQFEQVLSGSLEGLRKRHE